MTNLFSSFDPHINLYIITLGGNWISLIVPTIIVSQSYWLINSQLIKSHVLLFQILMDELLAVFGKGNMQGNIFLFLSLFIFILLSNTMGLVPYVFTATSHLVCTLSFAMPLWLGTIVWAVVNQYNIILAHLVPLGTPPALISPIVIIEIISSVIRPLTLAVRLAANMVAGHLLLSLMGSQLGGAGALGLMLVLVGLIILIILEIAVACIQSYVFTILNSLYLNEVRRELLNKIKI